MQPQGVAFACANQEWLLVYSRAEAPRGSQSRQMQARAGMRPGERWNRFATVLFCSQKRNHVSSPFVTCLDFPSLYSFYLADENYIFEKLIQKISTPDQPIKLVTKRLLSVFVLLPNHVPSAPPSQEQNRMFAL